MIGNGGRANANGYALGASSRSPLNGVDDYGWTRWVSDQDMTEGVLRKAGRPYGFYGSRSRYKPIEAGAMVSRFRCIVALDATASGAEGRSMIAAATLALDASAIGGLIAGGVASATLAIDGQAELSGVVKGIASATVALDGAAQIAAIGHLAASGEIAIDGDADMYAIGWMVATDDVSTTLTADGIASAVWNSALVEFQVNGSAGKALSSASSGGVDLDLMAQAVWAYVARTLTANPGITVDNIMTALESTEIPVDIRRVNGQLIAGSGSEADPWGP